MTLRFCCQGMFSPRSILSTAARKLRRRRSIPFFSPDTPCALYRQVSDEAQTQWPALQFCVGGGIWEAASGPALGPFLTSEVKGRRFRHAEIRRSLMRSRRKCRDVRLSGSRLRRAGRDHHHRDAVEGGLADCRLYQHARQPVGVHSLPPSGGALSRAVPREPTT